MLAVRSREGHFAVSVTGHAKSALVHGSVMASAQSTRFGRLVLPSSAQCTMWWASQRRDVQPGKRQPGVAGGQSAANRRRNGACAAQRRFWRAGPRSWITALDCSRVESENLSTATPRRSRLALDWDGEHGARELSEWLLARLTVVMLTSMRDRLQMARELLTPSGSVFVQS